MVNRYPIIFKCATARSFGCLRDSMFFRVQSLELWDMNESKTMTLPAHEGLIAALAVSNVNGLVASASHDKFVKLWK